MGALALMAYSLGVIAAMVVFAVKWSCEVLLACNIRSVEALASLFAGYKPVMAPEVTPTVTLESLDIFDTFAVTVLGLNACSFIDAEALALTTY